MTDLLNYLFSSSAWWIWTLVALAVLAAGYALHDRNFALTDLAYTFPLVGRLSRFSKDYSETYRGNGWLNVEDTLCRDYARHVPALSDQQFNGHVQYLRKCYDHGRSPLPFWAIALLVLLVGMEGLGFSYLLGALINPEASEYIRNWLMFGIVAVIAAILVWVMHAAGHQLYRTNLLRSCFKEFQANKDPSFTSHIVSLGERHDIDDHWPEGTKLTTPDGPRDPGRPSPTPEHVRCANRVATKPGDRGSYAWVWGAALLMLVIAVGSTILRVEMMHAEVDTSRSYAGMFQVGQTAQPVADAAAAGAREIASMTGFTILAVIFLATQIVGMSVGYRYGFAGKQSKEAYRATSGAPDYDTYWEPIQRRMNIANLRLHTLHRMLEKHSPRPIDFKKTFIDFIREERLRGADDLQLPPGFEAPPAKAGNGAARPSDAASPDSSSGHGGPEPEDTQPSPPDGR